MTFETSKQLDMWVEQHCEKCQTKAFDGAQFKYEFIPTGIVEVQSVKCMVCGEEFVVYED